MKNIFKAFAIVAGLGVGGVALIEGAKAIVEKSSQCPDGGDINECSLRMIEQAPKF